MLWFYSGDIEGDSKITLLVAILDLEAKEIHMCNMSCTIRLQCSDSGPHISSGFPLDHEVKRKISFGYAWLMVKPFLVTSCDWIYLKVGIITAFLRDGLRVKSVFQPDINLT